MNAASSLVRSNLVRFHLVRSNLVRSSRERLLLCFAFLQALDLISTLKLFSRGGSELNPIVGSLIPFTGPVVAVCASKMLLLWLAWRFSQRNWVLYFGIALYAAIVSWNFLLFLVAA